MITKADREADQPLFFTVLNFVVRILCGFLIATISIILFLAVIFRYLLHMPLGVAEELPRLIFMWLTFLGAALCAESEAHTRFDLFIKRLKPVPTAILSLISSVLILVFSATLVYWGFQGLAPMASERFVILDIPYAAAYLSLPVGASLISIYYLRHIYMKVRLLRAIYGRKGFLGDQNQR